MKIESIRLKNFKAFKDVEMRNIPGMCVVVGANGSGKSTLFSVFGFLKDALASNIQAALVRLGGSRGVREIRSRDTEGPIEIEIKFREKASSPLITYSLAIDEEGGAPIVEREIDDAMFLLLSFLAVVEYNGEQWFDVHPAVESILASIDMGKSE